MGDNVTEVSAEIRLADDQTLDSDASEFDTAESDDDDADTSDLEEDLLQAARAGDAEKIARIINVHPSINVNCKGRHKWNRQWTPLHLATYFGHLEAAKILLEKGADPSSPNGDGDTPLHKAALTGRESLVMLLLSHDADVFALNGEGRSAFDLTAERYLKNVLTAAEVVEKKRKEEMFFQAAKDGDVTSLQKLLSGSKQSVALRPESEFDFSLLGPRSPRRSPMQTSVPNVNCVDAVGNSALHAAAHRDHRRVALLLLQCGANPNLRNRRGMAPIDLARSEQMVGILKVPPIREIKNAVTRFEGPLIRKKRFLGSQAVWAVADRGVLSFFRNRADASTGTHRKRFHYLEGSVFVADARDERTITMVSVKGASERLSFATPLDRSRWLRVLKDHSKFSLRRPDSTSGDSRGEGRFEQSDSIRPLGSVQDAFRTAQAQQALLEDSVAEANRVHTAFLATSAQEGEFSVRAQNASHQLRAQLARVIEASNSAVSCMETCMLVMKQHEEARSALLEKEAEDNRILRETLAAFVDCSVRADDDASSGDASLSLDLGDKQPLTLKDGTNMEQETGSPMILGAVAKESNDDGDSAETTRET